MLGRSLKIDPSSLKLESGRYVRVSNEIDIILALEKGIRIGKPQSNLFHVVAYENFPPRCYHCSPRSLSDPPVPPPIPSDGARPLGPKTQPEMMVDEDSKDLTLVIGYDKFTSSFST